MISFIKTRKLWGDETGELTEWPWKYGNIIRLFISILAPKSPTFCGWGITFIMKNQTIENYLENNIELCLLISEILLFLR